MSLLDDLLDDLGGDDDDAGGGGTGGKVPSVPLFNALPTASSSSFNSDQIAAAATASSLGASKTAVADRILASVAQLRAREDYKRLMLQAARRHANAGDLSSSISSSLPYNLHFEGFSFLCVFFIVELNVLRYQKKSEEQQRMPCIEDKRCASHCSNDLLTQTNW